MTITRMLNPNYFEESLYFITDKGKKDKGIRLLGSFLEGKFRWKKDVSAYIEQVIKALEDPEKKGGALMGASNYTSVFVYGKDVFLDNDFLEGSGLYLTAEQFLAALRKFEGFFDESDDLVPEPFEVQCELEGEEALKLFEEKYNFGIDYPLQD